MAANKTIALASGILSLASGIRRRRQEGLHGGANPLSPSLPTSASRDEGENFWGSYQVAPCSQRLQRPLQLGIRVVKMRGETDVFAAGTVGAQRSDDAGGGQFLAQCRRVDSLAI